MAGDKNKTETDLSQTQDIAKLSVHVEQLQESHKSTSKEIQEQKDKHHQLQLETKLSSQEVKQGFNHILEKLDSNQKDNFTYREQVNNEFSKLGINNTKISNALVKLANISGEVRDNRDEIKRVDKVLVETIQTTQTIEQEVKRSIEQHVQNFSNKCTSDDVASKKTEQSFIELKEEISNLNATVTDLNKIKYGGKGILLLMSSLAALGAIAACIKTFGG